jgi:transposase
VIDVEDWAEIRRLHRAEGMGIKAIARRLGVARHMVRDALRSEGPPRYERAGTGSAVDAVEPEIRRLLGEFPHMPATVIAERIGWGRGITILRDRVAELRPLFVPPDPCQRTHYRPGELAQWDLWQPDVTIPVGFGQRAKLWVVVAVCGYSRLMGAWMIPSRVGHDVLGGTLQVLAQIGAVPRCAVWDREGCIGAWRQGRQVLTGEFQAFRGTLGMSARLCGPGDPEAKGPGRAGQWLSGDQLSAGSPVRGGRRLHPSTRRLAAPGEPAHPRHHQGPARRCDLGRPRRDAQLPASAPRPGLAVHDPSAPGSLRAGRHQRLQREPSLRRPPRRGPSHPRRGRGVLRRHRGGPSPPPPRHPPVATTPNHARILRAMRAEQAIAAPLDTVVEERDLAVYDRIGGVA